VSPTLIIGGILLFFPSRNQNRVVREHEGEIEREGQRERERDGQREIEREIERG
jgi:hypothetical protein